MAVFITLWKLINYISYDAVAIETISAINLCQLSSKVVLLGLLRAARVSVESSQQYHSRNDRMLMTCLACLSRDRPKQDSLVLLISA